MGRGMSLGSSAWLKSEPKRGSVGPAFKELGGLKIDPTLPRFGSDSNRADQKKRARAS